MRRAFLPLTLACALFAIGCGGRTGLEIRIDRPPELQAGVNFDKILVQVTVDSEAFGETYPISQATKEPFIVYVFPDEAKLDVKVRIQAQIQKGAAVIKDKILTDVTFADGEMKLVVVSFF